MRHKENISLSTSSWSDFLLYYRLEQSSHVHSPGIRLHMIAQHTNSTQLAAAAAGLKDFHQVIVKSLSVADEWMMLTHERGRAFRHDSTELHSAASRGYINQLQQLI